VADIVGASPLSLLHILKYYGGLLILRYLYGKNSSVRSDIWIGALVNVTISSSQKMTLGICNFNPLKPKLDFIAFTHLVRTLKTAQLITATNIKWCLLLEEIIAVYSENHIKQINTLTK
jgi:hypothetical protein